MATIAIKEIQHDKWGRVVSMNNGNIELMVTVEFGPRIIHFSAAGGSNLFYEEETQDIPKERDPAFDPVGGGNFKMYGGHRLWTSPEVVPRTTYPDNEPVDWNQNGDNTVVFKATPERWNQLTKEIEIQMDSSGPNVRVIHRVTNNGAWPITFAPWALSVMSTGGRAVVPMTANDTGLLPNRRFVLWPYNRLNDPRVVFTESAIVVNQGEGPTPYKFGSNNEAGWAAYSNHGDTFIKRYEPVAGGSYPDFGVSFELYTNSSMLELETLGELQAVESGSTASHTETWNIVKGLDLKRGSENQAVEQILTYVQK